MIRLIERTLDTLAALAVLSLGLLIVANVLSRQLLQVGIPDVIVIVRELMVPAILFPLASATSSRAHIAIEFVAQHFPDSLNRWIAVLAVLVGLLVATVLLWAGLVELQRNWASDARYSGDFQIPRWPSRLMFVIAFALFEVRLLQILWVDLKAAVTGTAAPATLQ